ncbi:MAG: hypothetical protein FWD14_01885 [Treponema sp.]|nr:hypothetical protein [Treponema sp.]
MIARILLRRDTTENWNAVNPILDNGEMGIEIIGNERKIKIGDGSSNWNNLSYATLTKEEIINYISDELDKRPTGRFLNSFATFADIYTHTNQFDIQVNINDFITVREDENNDNYSTRYTVQQIINGQIIWIYDFTFSMPLPDGTDSATKFYSADSGEDYLENIFLPASGRQRIIYNPGETDNTPRQVTVAHASHSSSSDVAETANFRTAMSRNIIRNANDTTRLATWADVYMAIMYSMFVEPPPTQPTAISILRVSGSNLRFIPGDTQTSFFRVMINPTPNSAIATYSWSVVSNNPNHITVTTRNPSEFTNEIDIGYTPVAGANFDDITTVGLTITARATSVTPNLTATLTINNISKWTGVC